MTNTPNSWTDGYGTVHPGAPPAGHWMASDDRWYAPELHPSYGTEPATTAEPVEQIIDHTVEPEHTVASEHTVEPGQKQPIVREPAGPATFDVSALESVLADLETTDEANPSDWTAPAAATLDGDPAMPDPAMPDPAMPGPGTPSAPVPNAAVPNAATSGSPMASPKPSNPNPMAEPSGRGNRVLIGAVVGVLAVLGVGAAAYMAFSGDDTSVVAGESPAILANAEDVADSNAVAESDADVELEEGEEAIPENGSPNETDPGAEDMTSPDLAGINSCARVDDQTLTIDMTNVSEETASYLMTVIYTDDAGTRVGDDTAYISSLRPGEQTLEAVYVFSDAGTGCEVIDVERYARNGTDGLADISACTVRAPADSTFLEADIGVTNSGATDSDYTVEVALIDPDGVRHGWGTAYVEQAPVGETVAGEIFTTVPFDETYQCQVVAVTRLESP